jgi:phosphoribosylamine--glycine ligase
MTRTAKVLVVGSGAREHSLAAAIAAEGHEVIHAPGNAGTELLGRNVGIRADDISGLVDLAVGERARLVVVGPEVPLVLGLVDALEARGVRTFGPSRAAARLEGSKAHMKRFCERHRIPTAPFAIFEDPDEAIAHLRRHMRSAPHPAAPLVVKADGIAAGKGVVVPNTLDEACDAVDRIMRKAEFGEAGRVVVLEERLSGEEVSFHLVCDGSRALALAPAQDHKRVGDADQGPNTGGMGAYAPAAVVTPAVKARIMREIVEPTLSGMALEGAPFRGAMFVGLMVDQGRPSVLEYNVRFGDPEATVLVPLYAGGWFELLDGAAQGDLTRARESSAPGAALSVVMAASGYPGKPRTGDRIEGLDFRLPAGAYVRHAGTTRAPDGSIVTSGGRVLTVGAHAPTLEQAARLAYDVVGRIHWEGEHHRHDIGARALTIDVGARGERS